MLAPRDLCGRRVCSSAPERSQIATIKTQYSLSHGVVSNQIYLTQYGMMAERHWREFRTKMVRELEKNGTLTEALFEAQERTIGEMEGLTRKCKPNGSFLRARSQPRKIIRETYILMSPEQNPETRSAIASITFW